MLMPCRENGAMEKALQLFFCMAGTLLHPTTTLMEASVS